jgi:two-component system response regulator YesN
MGMSYAGVVMPGNQPNMPCTHYQQLSRQKLSSGPVDSINVLYHTSWTNRGNLHTILDLTRTGIARSLEDAETIMDCSCLFSKNRMMGIHDAKLSQVNNRVFIPMDETKLLEFLRYQDEAYILSKLSVYIQSIKDQDLDPVYYTYLFSGITQAVVRFVEELGENVEDIIPELSCIVEMIDRVYSIDGFIYHTRKLISKIIEFRESKKHNKYGDVIWKARKFIDLNYSDSRLSLNMVAKHVNVSPSHFSTIFSQEIGMTFIEYLTSVRIAKAKEKLRTTNLKSSEIAYKVGYNDHHYFSHVFKKETGLRPTDFRANHSPESKII